MNTTFYVLLSIKTPDGLENFGRFYIGNDRQRAYELFGTLKGKDDIGDDALLYLELMETVNNLPLNLKMKSCLLAEVGENCSLITREVFRSQIQAGQ